MKINIYYGGRGLIGDPTLFAVRRMMTVFEELNVKVTKYDLFEQKNNISSLPLTIKDADAIILASTVEWHGVGGMIMSFLDACWLYGDKEKISKTYMAPVVMSTAYGEKEGELELTTAWLSLGGLTCQGLSGYVPEVSTLEQNEEYLKLIEKCAENIYRSVSQRAKALPVSAMAVSRITNKTRNTTLTQQETEQLSEYASDEKYVEKQKADIKELADLFKGRLGSGNENGEDLPVRFKKVFKAQAGVDLKYKINLSETPKPLILRVEGSKLEASYGELVYPDVELTMDRSVIDEITQGRKTFQGGFMEGSIKTKGDFKNLRMLDTLFVFG